MKIVMPGGTGQVGRMLARAFRKDGHEVVVLSRNPQSVFENVGQASSLPVDGASSPRVSGGRMPPELADKMSAPHFQTGTQTDALVRVVQWDGRSLGNWTAELEGADAVINLAGCSVNCRYTSANRRAIKESRVDSTRAVGLAIRQTARPPRVWLQASTATIYAHRFDASNDEMTGLLGGSEPRAPETWRFSIDVATAWEQAVEEVGTLPQTRKVLLRSAMTMSPDFGGVFDTLLALVRRGLGGCAGDGRQYVSWIHEKDFIRAIYWIFEHEALEGPINVTAPFPLPNGEFMRALRESWGVRFGLPASKWMLEVGAFLLRTETELILKSRRVVPGRLMKDGFKFEFPEWPQAARDLCERWRKSHETKPA